MPTAQRTAVKGRQSNNWNSFQRENKGRWDREELKRQWILYKQQLSEGKDVAADTAAAPSSRARDSDFSALKAGIRALLHKTSARDAAPETQSNDVDEAAPGQANINIRGYGSQLCTQVSSGSQIHVVQADVFCSSSSSSPQTPAARQGPRHLPYIAAAAPRCPARDTVTAGISCSSSTPPSERQVGVPDAACHVAASDAAAAKGTVNTCSSRSSSSPRVLFDAALSTAASTPSTAQQVARQLEQHGQDTAAGLDGQLEASPASSLGLSRLSEAHAQDLAQLREAVCSLLAKQGHQHALQEHKPPLLLQQHTPHQQHQQYPNRVTSHPAAAAVGTGCFGRGWASSRLSWNAFQKACKGRGLTKPEISAAYAAAKQHYQQTGDILDIESYLQQQQQHTTQGALQQPAQQLLVPTGKFATLHYWLRSRTSSRVPSRAGSTAVSPSSSPAASSRQQKQQQHHHRQQQDGTRQCGHSSGGPGGLWGDFKEWLHSRSSSRAASRLGTPAASPGDRYSVHKSCQQQQQDHHLPQQQQHDQEDPKAVVEAYMPFAQQLQEPPPPPPGPAQHQQQQEQQQLQEQQPQQQQQMEDGLTMQLPQQGHQHHLQQSSTAAPAAACPPVPLPDPDSVDPPQAPGGCLTLSPHLACASSSSRAPGLDQSGTAADNRASLAVIPPPAAPSAGSRSAGVSGEVAAASAEPAADQGIHTTHASHSNRPDHHHQQQQQQQYVRVGARLARESVPDDLPGVLEGFSQWMPADPQQLKRLKRAVPAKPGLYEWGVKLPCGVHGLGSEAGSTVTRAGQAYGPVLAFYLGKAGTLRPQRPRRSHSLYAATGETLRSRLNKYCLTRARRLGPVGEPHKAAIFAQQLQAGGRLYYRYCVLTSVEPVKAETQLLMQLNYAANYQHNCSRRSLLPAVLTD